MWMDTTITLTVAVEIAYGYIDEDQRPHTWRGDEH